MNLGFIIVATCETNKTMFYAIDPTSGGYPYWTSFLGGSKLFKTAEEAQQVLREDEFTRPSTMSDGTVFPPYLLHSGSGVNFERTEGSLVVSIAELKYDILSSECHNVKVER